MIKYYLLLLYYTSFSSCCSSDREYPRLGQVIVDYENPLKKMMEEFVPHGKVAAFCCLFTHRTSATHL